MTFLNARFIAYLVKALALWLVINAGAVQAERIAGSDVALDAPPGFEPARVFTGLQQLETFSAIELRELAAPFVDIKAQLNSAAFAAAGVALVSTQAVDSQERPALLLELEMEISGVEFNKWLLLIGDDLRSITLTASYPRWAAATMREPLRASLLTARWLRSARDQLFFDLPFTVAESQRLKYVKRSANTVVLAGPPAPQEGAATAALITIGYHNVEEELTDARALSHRQLGELPSVDVIEILSEQQARVDGIPAYRITASARRLPGGERVRIEQLIAVQPHRYLLVNSSVAGEMAGDYRQDFAAVIDSIRFKK